MASPADGTDLVWHYTSAAGLLNIISSSKLWASSAAFMNDREELLTGQEALAKHFALRKDALEPWQRQQLQAGGIERLLDVHASFLLCGTKGRDLLTMWRGYGGDQPAYAIGLDRSVPLRPVEQDPRNSQPEPAPPHYYDDARIDLGDGEYASNDPDGPYSFGGEWKDVTYIEGATDAAVQVEFDRLLTRLAKPADGRFRMPFMRLDFVGSPTDYWKHPAFEDEREVRATWHLNPTWKFVRYRSSRFGLIPYLEVSTLADREVGSNYISHDEAVRLPIREITIGPAPFGRDAERALRGFLDDKGYGETSISLSVTPFR